MRVLEWTKADELTKEAVLAQFADHSDQFHVLGRIMKIINLTTGFMGQGAFVFESVRPGRPEEITVHTITCAPGQIDVVAIAEILRISAATAKIAAPGAAKNTSYQNIGGRLVPYGVMRPGKGVKH